MKEHNTSGGRRKELPDWLRVKSGLLDPKHVTAIGPALWEFLLLVHWQTHDDGTVKGGKPIRAEEIAKALGRPQRNVERNLPRLAPYLETTRTPYGIKYRILNPGKFERTAKSGGSADREPPDMADLFGGENRQIWCREPPDLVERTARSGGNKEDKKDRRTEEKRVARAEARRNTSPPPIDCEHSPKCKNRPWHVLEVIREAQQIPPLGPGESHAVAELANAKRMLGETADADIRGTVEFLRRDEFWRAKRIPAPTVASNLGAYRRERDKPKPADAMESYQRRKAAEHGVSLEDYLACRYQGSGDTAGERAWREAQKRSKSHDREGSTDRRVDGPA